MMEWVIGMSFQNTPELPAWSHDYAVELVYSDDGWLLRLEKSGGADAHTVTSSTCTCGHHMWRDAQCKHMLLWSILRRKLGMYRDIAP